MTRHLGSCHCGAVTFAIEAEIDHLTACDYSLCVKKNARMVRLHEDALTVLSGEEQLGVYVWNTHRARHHFCRSGPARVWTCRWPRRARATSDPGLERLETGLPR